jgi:DICT domain-containing protein
VKNFSIFEQALNFAQSLPAEDLGSVAYVSRRDFDERRTFHFRAQVPCLEYLSLLIENALLLKVNRTGRVYAGFEKLSQLEAIADRYLRIADLSERLYIFGEVDWKPPRHPNMKVVAMPPDSKLGREWFVISDSPTLRVALVAFDESAPGSPMTEDRTFRALKSSDAHIVTHLSSIAEELIDSSLVI